INDFVADVSQVESTLYLEECNDLYGGSALSDSVASAFTAAASGNPDNKNIAVTIDIDPAAVALDSSIYSESDLPGDVTADVDFCVRFGLYTPNAAGEDEVNYLETIIRLDVDLSDGFNITAVAVEPLERCEFGAEDEFLVEGYFCRDDFEYDSSLGQDGAINQGDLVKICVRPQERGLESGVRMRRISSFAFTRQLAPVINQPAIENALPAANGLTEVFCAPGHAICFFETILYAQFFTETTQIAGSGVADLQFGGEDSMTSVSPRTAISKRRALRSSDDRLLQEGETAAQTAFDLDLEVGQGTLTNFGDSSDAPSTRWGIQVLAMGLGMAAVLF
ncbi:MAG: hypothetical protein SGARI_004445, partial [Bacillariaceae sp.]